MKRSQLEEGLPKYRESIKAAAATVGSHGGIGETATVQAVANGDLLVLMNKGRIGQDGESRKADEDCCIADNVYGAAPSVGSSGS